MRNLTLLLALFFAGCSFSQESAPSAVNTCGTEADCAGAVCDEGVCVLGSVAPFFATLEVSRGPDEVEGNIPESWTVDLGVIDGSTILDVDLPETVPVRGRVRWQGLPVPAKLTFTRIDQTVGSVKAIPVEVLTNGAEVGGNPDSSFDYAVRLVRDANYEVIVEPTRDIISGGEAASVLPPARIPSVTVALAETDPQAVSVTYSPSLSDACDAEQVILCTLSGKIVVTVGESGQVPQRDLFVLALENATGRVVSSIGMTNDEGDFAIRIGDGVGDYSLRFSQADGSLLPFPVVTVPVSESPVLIQLPQPVLPISFVGSVKGPDELPVSFATVHFSSSRALGPGTATEFSTTAETGPDGGFTVELLPVSELYRVLITPPQDDTRPLGVLFEEVSVLEVEHVFQLPNQISLSGSVSSREGDPFVGVAMSARSRGGADGALAGLSRSRDTTTNSFGEFGVNLDVGRYDLQVKPPVESGFAWLVEPDVVLETDEVRNWQYDLPVSIAGTIRDGTGAFAVDATVRLFFEIGGPGGMRALRVAEATVDDEGRYRLLVNPL